MNYYVTGSEAFEKKGELNSKAFALAIFNSGPDFRWPGFKLSPYFKSLRGVKLS